MPDTKPLPPDATTAPVFGVRFDDVALQPLANTIADGPTPGQGTRLVVTANVDHIVLLRDHAGLQAAYRNSWRRTIDGTPVWLYTRFRHGAAPERVTGADLFPEVLTRLVPGRHRPFFVVANADIANRMAAWTGHAGFAPDTVGFEVPPFGFERDADHGRALAARIRANGTTHLFFGVGCPRSEVWIDRHRDELGDVYALAVGAAVGFHVGVQWRAPRAMRRYGMEWLWRLLSEPRRLGPRYMVRSWAFLTAIRSDLNDKEIKA
ncbi:WecB/TagA/CpsF family glycosyltransferase [Sphingomonas faeni]|uniref:WecB/TagA/CpsF family glycosyltransferase n=1 Tax=Sphingomonas faeni TaxID=185950 RepID=UPI003353E841